MNDLTKDFLSHLDAKGKGALVSPHLWLWYNDRHELAVWISQHCNDVFPSRYHFVVKCGNVWFYFASNGKLQHVDYLKEKLRFYTKSKKFKIVSLKK